MVDENANTAPETKNWMIEDFPINLRWRCKRAANHKHVALKQFVREIMQKAVEQVEAEMLGSVHESAKEELRRGSDRRCT